MKCVSTRVGKWVLGLALLSSVCFGADTVSTIRPEELDQKLPVTVTVPHGFDGNPFSYRITDIEETSEYWLFSLEYPSPVKSAYEPNNTVPAEYWIPKSPGPAKRPAVICLHILDGSLVLTRMACSHLARHGIPALLFHLPYYGKRGFPDGPKHLAENPQLLTQAIEQAWGDVRRAVDLLAARPEVDPNKIGIAGISLGALVAASAAGADARIHRTMLVLGGGDLLTIIQHAKETRPLRQMMQRLEPSERKLLEDAIRAVDPLRFAPALRDRAQQGLVLMVNAENDEVIPRECTIVLARQLGIEDRIVWLKGLGHYTSAAELPHVLQMACEFFAADMPELLQQSAKPLPASSPAQKLASVVQEAVALAFKKPASGCCHFLDLAGTAGWQEGKTSFHLRWIHDDQGRFLLALDVPEIAHFEVGRQDCPWLLVFANGKQTLFLGTNHNAPVSDVADYIDQNHFAWIKATVGMAEALGSVPDLLERWLNIRQEGNCIVVSPRDGTSPKVTFEFTQQNRPGKITYQDEYLSVELVVNNWAVNVPAFGEVFRKPASDNVKRVSAEDLYRMMAAVIEFAVEQMR